MAELSGITTPQTPEDACVSEFGTHEAADVIDTPPFSEDEAEREEEEEETKSEESDQTGKTPNDRLKRVQGGG